MSPFRRLPHNFAVAFFFFDVVYWRLVKKLLLVVVLALIFPNAVLAKIGVGVGSGKIQVEDKLKPGTIYQLPPLTVLNTGDEPSDYGLSIEYHEKQPELRPQQKWFIFSPSEFHLKPDETKVVDIKLNLPVRMEPGNYFAYLEAHPIKKSQSGNTAVNIAAAAKLYFTVLPANPVLGVYYKAASFWKINQPWSSRLAVGLAIIILYWGMKKYLGFQIGFVKKEAKKETIEKEENE